MPARNTNTRNAMRSHILCHERLNRIQSLLDRYGNPITVRDFSRRFAIFNWELEQAENLGWIKIIERKPHVGRPSVVVEKLSETQSAKLPPFRYAIPKEISIRHWRFALESVSCSGFKLTLRVQAYLRAFPNARSRAGASASASRLMKRTDVKLMRRWLFCQINHEVTGDMPRTVSGLIEQLAPLGYIRYRLR